MIEIINSISGLRSLECRWNELADDFKTPLLCHEWFLSCAEAFSKERDLFIVVNKDKGIINAIAPLKICKKYKLKKFEILGAEPLGEPSGFIYKDEKSLSDLLKFIYRLKRTIKLSRMKEESYEVEKLLKIKKIYEIICRRSNSRSPFLPIICDLDEYRQKMTSKQRYDLKRAKKRAKNTGELKFEIISPDYNNLNEYLELVFKIEASGWKKRTGTAISIDKKLGQFFRSYSKKAAYLGILKLCFLKINEKPVAALLAVVKYKRFWTLKIGYDEQYSECSPGILLMDEAIRYAFSNELKAFEFLGSDARWMHIWTKNMHSYLTTRIYPVNINGMLWLTVDSAKGIIARAKKRCGIP